jgi:hypothetical protein
MDKKSLTDLAKCLSEAGRIVTQLNGSTSATINNTSSSSTRLEAAMSAVGRTVNRAQSMVQNSTNRGLFSRLNGRERLRAMSGTSAPPSKKSKPVEKTFEFVLLHSGGQLFENDTFLLDDDSIALRGIVTLNSIMTEENIRACLAEAIVLKFPSVAPQDLEFLKANRRKMSKPVNAGEFSFKEIKLLAGQGCIYVTLKDGFECLLEDGTDSIPSCNDPKETNPEKEDNQDKEPANRHNQNMQDKHQENPETSQNSQEDDKYLLKSIWGRNNDVESAVKNCLKECETDKITKPVEVLRCAQKHILQGRVLDTTSAESSVQGEVHFIDVNRYDLLKTTFDELEHLDNLRLTLQVTFYGEVAHDNGGPRKEFFRLCLRAIKEKYFDNGLHILLADDYEKIGIVMAMSILQNGPVPRFLEESILQELFQNPQPSPCISKLRVGFDKLGLYQIGKASPMLLHLMRPSESYQLTRRKLISLLAPSFSEEGSNARMHQMTTYDFFKKYVREAASGRRAAITLGHILQFTTGVDEEPFLGFALPPCIHFNISTSTSKWSFIPTANTCTQTLYLPTGSHRCPLPVEEELFDIYDNAFSNVYFGLA